MFFFVLFCCFCRIWLTKCPQTENKKEPKRSCRRENRKMSFDFFVVGPPPPPHHVLYICLNFEEYDCILNYLFEVAKYFGHEV